MGEVKSSEKSAKVFKHIEVSSKGSKEFLSDNQNMHDEEERFTEYNNVSLFYYSRTNGSWYRLS